MSTQVKDKMTSEVLTININKPYTVANRMFYTFNINHLPVVNDNDELLGIFSSTDSNKAFNEMVINRAITTEEDINSRVSIEEYMTSNSLFTLRPEDDLEHAKLLFKENVFHSIPVVEGKKLVGILTTKDLL